MGACECETRAVHPLSVNETRTVAQAINEIWLRELEFIYGKSDRMSQSIECATETANTLHKFAGTQFMCAQRRGGTA